MELLPPDFREEGRERTWHNNCLFWLEELEESTEHPDGYGGFLEQEGTCREGRGISRKNGPECVMREGRRQKRGRSLYSLWQARDDLEQWSYGRFPMVEKSAKASRHNHHAIPVSIAPCDFHTRLRHVGKILSVKGRSCECGAIVQNYETRKLVSMYLPSPIPHYRRGRLFSSATSPASFTGTASGLAAGVNQGAGDSPFSATAPFFCLLLT
jgi:hypothetical protein